MLIGARSFQDQRGYSSQILDDHILGGRKKKIWLLSEAKYKPFFKDNNPIN